MPDVRIWQLALAHFIMEAYARNIIEDKLGQCVRSIKRFSTGLSHMVFEVVTEHDGPYVVRIARPERNGELESGIIWQEKLEDLEIPLPQLYRSGQIEGHAYAVYERLPGSDLEEVYPSLPAGQKRDLAIQVAEIQQKVHTLGEQHFEGTHSWVDVINTIVTRSEKELLAKGERNNPYVAHTRHQIQAFESYFAAVEPVAFLYDLNVRNVIVDGGVVTGIIDVDELWFGDPLLATGRGKTILMTMKADIDFISHWCHYLNLSAIQLRAVDFYALLYSVRFMGTLGQKLNGNYSLQTDPQISGLLEQIANEMLVNLDCSAA